MPRTGLARQTTGGKSYTAWGVEYTPNGTGTVGTPVTRTQFAPIKSNGMIPARARLKDNVQSATRLADRINIGGVVTAAGPVQWHLSPSLMIDFMTAAVGATASATAVTATTTGPVVTGLGISTIPVTGAFTPFQAVDFNTGANLERVVVLSYTTGSLVTTALTKSANVAAATGVSLTQVAATNIRHSLLPAGYDDDFMRLTVERVIGGHSGFLFPGTAVDKLTVNLAPGFIMATADCFSTSSPTELTSGQLTAYNPNTTSEKQALKPFTGYQAVIALPQDSTGAGSGTYGSAVGIRTGSIVLDNAPLKFDVLGQLQQDEAFGDAGGCTFTYDEIDVAQRPMVWTDFIAQDIPAAMAVMVTRNYGTNTSPDYGSIVFGMPNMVYETSALQDAVNTVIGYNNTASSVIDRGISLDHLQISVAAPV